MVSSVQYITRQRGGLYIQPTCSLNMDFEDDDASFTSSSSSSSSFKRDPREDKSPNQRQQSSPPSYSRNNNRGGGGSSSSSNNDIFVFSHLLETHKPFLTSVFKIKPHLLFLIAKTIDIDLKCTKVLFDHWLLVEFGDVPLGMKCIVDAIKIRSKLELMYENTFSTPSTSTPSSSFTSRNKPTNNNNEDEDDTSKLLPTVELQALRREWLQVEERMARNMMGTTYSNDTSGDKSDSTKVHDEVVNDTNDNTVVNKTIPVSSEVCAIQEEKEEEDLSILEANQLFVVDTQGVTLDNNNNNADKVYRDVKNNNHPETNIVNHHTNQKAKSAATKEEYSKEDGVQLIEELEAWLEFDWKCLNVRKLQGNTLERLLFDPFQDTQQAARLYIYIL